ncbi:hypothetical protein ABZ770_06095 [Streptomyces sp. NPDC006654]|uniref:Rv1733c family protein n=1 Tax=Streptomyces sp. NPDC006654 TaxID=3156897 RepID=UPI0033C145BD
MAETPPATVTPVRLWHWRRNPLRRRSDVIEGWIIAVGWILAVACAVFAGVTAARVTDAASAARASQVHAATAVVTDGTPGVPAGDGKYGDWQVRAAVRWTDPDGSVHTGQAVVPAGAPAGTRVPIWADRAGHVVGAPVSATAATVQAALTGILVGPLAGAAVWAVGKGIRVRLVRRRLAEWDEEWKKTGPRWGNLSGGRG